MLDERDKEVQNHLVKNRMSFFIKKGMNVVVPFNLCIDVAQPK